MSRPDLRPDDLPTAGQVRRATLRAFHRHEDEFNGASTRRATGQPIGTATPPIELVKDELTRRPVPNRRDRRRARR